MLGLLQVRLIEHPSVERRDTCARRKRRDDFLRVFHIRLRGRKGGVDHLHLMRMNRKHAGESFALGRTSRARETGGVVEVGIQCFDRIDTCRLGRNQRKRAHNLVSEQEFAVVAAIAGGTNRC